MVWAVRVKCTIYLNQFFSGFCSLEGWVSWGDFVETEWERKMRQTPEDLWWVHHGDREASKGQVAQNPPRWFLVFQSQFKKKSPCPSLEHRHRRTTELPRSGRLVIHNRLKIEGFLSSLEHQSGLRISLATLRKRGEEPQ